MELWLTNGMSLAFLIIECARLRRELSVAGFI